MINYFSKYKFVFYLCNIFLLLEYLYPGSLLGCIIFNNCKIQPQLTPDFIISSNHFYVFFILSIVGFFTYTKSHQIIFLSIYLISLSFFLEIMHYIIPNRSFEFPDLFGNLVGVIPPIVLRFVIKKNENFKN
tara:strand:+ start:124 stop:519 length:396 start_codon:yes stop_codon:yes gene_type:complete